MGNQEEIFEEFFKELEEDEKFPDKIIEELKELWKNGAITSKERIFEVIKGGCEDVRED